MLNYRIKIIVLNPMIILYEDVLRNLRLKDTE
jgi:hypothetical protein